MLRILNLHYAIGERRILDGIDWIINSGQRVALVGPNGAGKTTLLRILCEELNADAGTLQMPKTYRLGYLPQEPLVLNQGTLLDVAMSTHPELMDLEQRIRRLQDEVSHIGRNHAALMNALGEAQHQYEAMGGYTLEADARSILSGLGFKITDLYRPIAEFSGGWRMRGYLTRLLLQAPDLLLLDEPTNHLDLETLEWLEGYLQGFRGGMVIVSHDRFFIDRLADEICELSRGKLKQYRGKFRQYEEQKHELEAIQEKLYQRQQDEIAKQKVFIDRFRAKATKAAQVQSRIKQLEKIDRVEKVEKKRNVSFRFRVAERSYKDVLQIEDVRFRYDENWVLQGARLRMYRGDRVALVGPNGAGKTTLTRLVKGELLPHGGSMLLGERVRISHYAQHQVEALRLHSTIFEEVYAAASEHMAEEVRTVLGLFQFTGDDVFKRIGVLSGGEKARVSLAKILISPANFLIMDEPVNHLDVASRAALETALSDYDGTMLIISHDRYFLDKLVQRVVEVKEGKLIEYLGNYSQYMECREQARELEAEEKEGKLHEAFLPGEMSVARRTKRQRRVEAEARNALSRRLQPFKDRIRQIEAEVQVLETRKTEIEGAMSCPETYKDSEVFVELQKEYARVRRELDVKLVDWEKAEASYEREIQGAEH